jgi:putative ABC transport system permease protein
MTPHDAHDPLRAHDWRSEIRAALQAGAATPHDDVIDGVVEELSQHAAQMYDSARVSGRTDAEARQDVRTQIAAWRRERPAIVENAAARRGARRPAAVTPPPALDPESPAARGLLAGRFTGVVHDIRYAIRLLRRQPGYALVSLLTLTLGIGATTALFSVTYGVLLRPLPWPDADRLVRLFETREGSTAILPPLMTNVTYLAWQEHATTVDAFAAWRGDVFTLTGVGDALRVRVVGVTPSTFDLLRAKPLLGTLFGPQDVVPGEPHVAIISYGLWQERFGGRPDVLGRTLSLDGNPHTIVAVMPRTFAFPDVRTRVWRPYYVPPVVTTDARQQIALFDAMARLKPGVTAAQATAEATAAGRGAPDPGMVKMAVFGSNGPVKITTEPAIEAMTKEVKPALVVLLIAVALLLLTATANVASLQLARATTRRREMAIRSAIGAGTGRLTRQLLIENLLIGLASGLLGLLLAFALHRAMPALLPADFPRLDHVFVDVPVMIFALATALADDGQAPVGAGARSRTARARMTIMAGQVAIACVLLLGAGLLARSFQALMHADRGYDPTNLLTAQIPLPDASYDGKRRAAWVEALLARLQALPSVKTVAFSSVLPLQNRDALSAFRMISHRDASAPEVTVQARMRIVSAGYFQAMGVRLSDGRFFTDRDGAGAAPVIIVNRAFANKYLGTHPFDETLPVGKNADTDPNRAIVGIIDNMSYRGTIDAGQPEIFVPYRQLADGIDTSEPFILVRTGGSPRALIAPLRELVHEADPNVAVEAISTLEDQLSTSLARPRLYAVLLGAFAFFALLIAAIGLFGVLSYSVAQRTREIGVRAALGAEPRDIISLVVRQGLLVTLGGVIVGVAIAAALARYLTTLLYGVAARDTTTFVVVPLAVLCVAAAACFFPARRAARVDPLKALRSS